MNYSQFKKINLFWKLLYNSEYNSTNFRHFADNQCNFFVYNPEIEDVIDVVHNYYYESKQDESVENKVLKLFLPIPLGEFNRQIFLMFSDYLKLTFQEFNYTRMYDTSYYTKMILTNEADITIILSPVNSRGRHLLLPIMADDNDLFFKTPEPILPSTLFLTVFDISIWLSVLAVIVITILFLYAYKKVYKLSKTEYVSVIMQVLGLSSEEIAAPKLSYNFSSTIVAIFSFLIAASFSTFLITHLSLSKPDLSFTGLSDLLSPQSKHDFCVTGNALRVMRDHMPDYVPAILNNERCKQFKFTTRPTLIHMLKTLCANPNAVYLEIGEYYKTIMINRKLKYLETCDISILNHHYFKTYWTYSIGSMFKYRNQFNVLITKLHTTGIMKRMNTYRNKYLIQAGIVDETFEIVDIQLKHLQLIFLGYIAAMMIALLILVSEILIKRLGARRRTNKKRLFIRARK